MSKRRHQGLVLKNVLKERGIKYSWLAEKMGVNRNTITNWTNTMNLGYDRLMEIGRILSYDFTKDFPEMELAYSKQPPDSLYAISTLGECREQLYLLQTYPMLDFIFMVK